MLFRNVAWRRRGIRPALMRRPGHRGAGTRHGLRFEPLEPRMLLSADPGLDPDVLDADCVSAGDPAAAVLVAAEQDPIGRYTLYVTVRLEQPIADLPGWVHSQDWPQWMGDPWVPGDSIFDMGRPVHVMQPGFLEPAEDPDGGYRQTLFFEGIRDISPDQAIADLEQLDCVDAATLDSADESIVAPWWFKHMFPSGTGEPPVPMPSDPIPGTDPREPDPPAVEPPPAQPVPQGDYSLYVTVQSEQPITDLNAWGRSRVWPQWMGDPWTSGVSSSGTGPLCVSEVSGYPPSQDPDGTYRHTVWFAYIRGVSADQAIADLEQLDFVDRVRLDDPVLNPPGPNVQEPVDLEVVDCIELENQSPVAGELWYRFEAMRDGILNLRLFEPQPPLEDGQARLQGFFLPNVELYEYDDLGELHEMTPSGGAVKYYEAVGGRQYVLRVTEVLRDIYVAIANQVSVDYDAGLVHAYGTDAEDTLEFSGGKGSISRLESANEIKLNGFYYAFDAEEIRSVTVSDVETVTLHGNEGDDRFWAMGPIRICSAGEDPDTWAETHFTGDWGSVWIKPAHAQSGAADGRPALQIRVHSNGGYDVASLSDSSGDDTFVAAPDYAALSAGGVDAKLMGFKSVEVHGGRGQDVARLYDSPGNDVFLATPSHAGLSGDGFNHEVFGFDGVHAYGTAGGIDEARLYDSPGNDTFYGSPTEGALYGAGFYNRAKHFDGVHAYGIAGGIDVARLYDSPGDDTFYGDPDQGALYGTGYYNRAKYFDGVHAYGTAGGNDVAKLYGSTANDAYYGSPTECSMWTSGDDWYNRAVSFDEVYGHLGQGGDDAVNLWDSAGDEILFADNDSAGLSNSAAGWSFKVSGLDSLGDVVYAHSNPGDNDTEDINWPALLFTLDLTDWN